MSEQCESHPPNAAFCSCGYVSDKGYYRTCDDPECPAVRPGTNHAHLVTDPQDIEELSR